jgi:hypothetical protein
MGYVTNSPVSVSRGASIWSLYERHVDPNQVSFKRFQTDFRAANPAVGRDGHLDQAKAYHIPSYEPVADDQPAGGYGPPPGTGPAVLPGQTGPGPAAAVPTGLADGSSPGNAIKVQGPALADMIDTGAVVDFFAPDALVFAAAGEIGVQDIPGWTAIPGLKNMGEGATIKYMAAVLIPVDGRGSLNESIRPQDSTLFVSLTIPGVKNPVIFTVRLSDMLVEGGTKIVNKSFRDGGIIAFSNMRVGIPESADQSGASVNGGILFRSAELKGTVKQLKTLVKMATRTAQGAQAVGAAVAAPETGGASIPAAATTMVATELLRGTIDKSLDNASYYWGFAWRGETTFNAENGQVTVMAKKGSSLEGKWITFDVGEIPGALFDQFAPDFSAPDKQWLISQGATPETAETMARAWNGDDDSMRPLVVDMAAYLGVSTPELMQWFNAMNKRDLEHYVTYDMSRVPQHDGSYSWQPSAEGTEWPPNSVADVITLADIRERYPDLPRGT